MLDKTEVDLPILILTVGLPRSGKSTWALLQGHPIVCPDAIRLALHGTRYREEMERMVWAMAHLMVHSLFKAGHAHVIVDATNGTRKRRDEWKNSRWKLRLKVIATPADICRQRARYLRDEEILPVIDRMAAQWEHPLTDELLWNEPAT